MRHATVPITTRRLSVLLATVAGAVSTSRLLRRTSERGPKPPPLPWLARRLLFVTFVAALGNGLVLPFLVVYLSQVRGMSTAVGGLAIAWTAVLGFVLTPVGGHLIDSLGPKPVIVVGMTIEGIALGGWAFVHEPWQAFAVATLLALGGAGVWSAASTLLTRAVDEDQRQRAFGINFLLLNLGIGIGGLVSGLVVDVARPNTFVVLYLVDGAMALVAVVLIAVLRGVGGPVPRETHEEQTGGYRDVLADKALVRLVVVSVVMLTCGYGAIEVGYPVFATTQAGLSASLVAYGYVGNTVAIVLGQMYVLRVISGRSRSRLMALVGVVWAAAWVLLGLAVPLAGHAALLVALLSPAVFAVGETIWQPILPSIVNELAPEHLRGRYNAMIALSWNVSGTLGPALTGILLGAHLSGLWIALVVGGCLLAGLGALRLSHVLTAEQDGRFPQPAGPVEG
jgi:MFS family permease